MRFIQDLTARHSRYVDLRDMHRHIAAVEKDVAAMREKRAKYQEMYDRT
jgi:hypothetical protein